MSELEKLKDFCIDLRNFYKIMMDNCPSCDRETFEYNKGKWSAFNMIIAEIWDNINLKTNEKSICGLCKFSESIPYEDDVFCSTFRCNKGWKNTCEKFQEY